MQLMEGEIIPFSISKGMTVIASFRGEEDSSVSFWIRRFEDKSEKKSCIPRYIKMNNEN